MNETKKLSVICCFAITIVLAFELLLFIHLFRGDRYALALIVSEFALTCFPCLFNEDKMYKWIHGAWYYLMVAWLVCAIAWLVYLAV